MNLSKYQTARGLLVHAAPMTHEEFAAYMGCSEPTPPGDGEGYIVESCTDASCALGEDFVLGPNHEEHVGFLSWSPKEIFEADFSKA